MKKQPNTWKDGRNPLVDAPFPLRVIREEELADALIDDMILVGQIEATVYGRKVK